MILYRARTLASRPSRLAAYHGNEPHHRIIGRWFTSDHGAALRHLETLDGPAEIVAVEVPDAIVDSFRVATTPHTRCGLSPIDFSTDPETDYVLQTFRVMDATVLATGGNRARDVIDVAINDNHRLPLAA